MAHKLKWTMYSSLVIPPLPISSMSGSSQHTYATIRKYMISQQRKTIHLHDYLYMQISSNRLTIPPAASRKISIDFIHVSSRDHTARAENASFHLARLIVCFK